MTDVEAKIAAQEDQLYLGDAIEFFLNSKHAGGRSEKTIDDYRKKLELFQRWISGEEFDAPYINIGADEIESYMVHLKDQRGMADSSRKNHLAVLRSFFKSVSKRLKALDPSLELDEARFHSPVPERAFLTKREADLLLSTVEAEVTMYLKVLKVRTTWAVSAGRSRGGRWPRAATRRSR